jgi:hypothetical protein
MVRGATVLQLQRYAVTFLIDRGNSFAISAVFPEYVTTSKGDGLWDISSLWFSAG